MKRRLIIMTCLGVIIALTGCSNDRQSASAPEKIEEKVEADVEDETTTEIPTETEEKTEPTKVIDPTETPTPTPNPYEIGGMDFKYFFDKGNNWVIADVTRNYEFDRLRVLITNNAGRFNLYDANPLAVIDDGDKYTLTLDEDKKYDTNLNTFAFLIYTPKPCKEWKLKGEDELDAFYTSDFWYDEMPNNLYQDHLIPAYFYVNRTKAGEDRELHDTEFSVSVTYEDDTQETITVYLTKEFILNY